MTALCPCCGARFERPDPYQLVDFLPISGMRRALLVTLAANFGRELPTELLVERVYAGVRNGGPLGARRCVSVYAYQLRKILKPYGLTVRGNAAAGSYRLDWIDAPALRRAI
jgi:hypothetical protein